jgi:hypothetical protein
MQNNTLNFDSIFEGMDLPEDFTAKLKQAFEEAVEQRVEAKMGPMTKSGAYAVGTKKAMEMTGDEPPLEKSTIRKAHKIAKGVMKSAGIKEGEELTEEEDDVTLESEYEDDEEMTDDEEELTEAEITADDIRKLLADTDIIRVLNAADEQRGKFAASMRSALTDLYGNQVAEPFLNMITSLFDIIANDTRISTLIAQELKKSETPAEGETTTTEEEIDNIDVYEQVEKYLTYAAETFVEENRLAVEQGLKIEIMESFWAGFKNLFNEHNIQIPEEQSVIDDLNTKISALENKLIEQKESFDQKINEQISKTIVYKTRAEQETKKNIFESVAKDLSLTQREKFSKLVEEVTFDSKKTYEEKLKDIAKNIFESTTKSKKTLTEESIVGDQDSDSIESKDPVMNLYAQAISKNLKF